MKKMKMIVNLHKDLLIIIKMMKMPQINKQISNPLHKLMKIYKIHLKIILIILEKFPNTDRK